MTKAQIDTIVRYMLRTHVGHKTENATTDRVTDKHMHLVSLTMRRSCDELTEKHRACLDNMYRSLERHSGVPYSRAGYVDLYERRRVYEDLCDEIFQDDINWGRIISAFSLINRMFCVWVEDDRRFITDCIARKVGWWIDTSEKNGGGGGWKTFADVYKESRTSTTNVVGNLVTIALSALGLYVTVRRLL
ncbi:hypothetical protein RRG08_010270 [Elysia crispata]|uniref:Bcl-2 Bcl-2 homology region 1-3 domain-containing protein n=1 Tax=Elysia crispata TaxID=231223 RepID=A0AAE0Z3P2_9GAST|nr:hypothetical protein RRG08_010270 [Elysia crispata]